MRNITKIIVHCTATPAGRPETVQSIDRYHRSIGWDCIGYHYLVTLDGVVHLGRAEDKIGAHCKGYNATSIGVAYVGGLSADGKTPRDTRNAAQKEGLLRILTKLKEKYPKATIHGHNEFAAKACPCFDARKEYRNL